MDIVHKFEQQEVNLASQNIQKEPQAEQIEQAITNDNIEIVQQIGDEKCPGCPDNVKKT